MRYALLLRGINVGGKNKVVMADLKKDLAGLGFENPVSYINSGNLFFDSEEQEERIREILSAYFSRSYDFPLPFVLVSSDMLQKETAIFLLGGRMKQPFGEMFSFICRRQIGRAFKSWQAVGQMTRSSCISGRRLSIIAMLTKRTISSPTIIKNCSNPIFTSN